MKTSHKVALGAVATAGVLVAVFWDEVLLAWLALKGSPEATPPPLPMQAYTAAESTPTSVP
jgi:hypothetical protein